MHAFYSLYANFKDNFFKFYELENGSLPFNSNPAKYKDLLPLLEEKKVIYNYLDLKKRDLIQEFLDIKHSQKEASEKKRDLNSFICKSLNAYQPCSFLDEMMLNCIKIKVEALSYTLHAEDYFCCKIHFQLQFKTKCPEDQNKEFKKYYWPLEKPSLVIHLQKTVASFLNSSGGIIYIGLYEDKNKLVSVVGMALRPKEKKDFLCFMKSTILSEIYPRIPEEGGFEDGEHVLNKYVSVDFLDIFEEETLLNAQAQKDGVRLYIVRVKVKYGDPFELYHLNNRTNFLPEAYIREDKVVKNKTMQEFITEAQKRFKAKLENRPSEHKTTFHDYCRFELHQK